MKLKMIEWHDSRGVGANWNFASAVKDDGICKVRSVGWVIAETKNWICIVPHLALEAGGDNQVCGEMHIPKSCIDTIRTIKLKGLAT